MEYILLNFNPIELSEKEIKIRILWPLKKLSIFDQLSKGWNHHLYTTSLELINVAISHVIPLAMYSEIHHDHEFTSHIINNPSWYFINLNA